MRGAITYEEMMRRTPGERDMFNAFINKRLDAEKSKVHPVY